MTLCINPNCQHPHNSDTTAFCTNCGSKLLLKERYRPIKLLGEGGFGRTFLAVDEDIPSKPSCAVKQFNFSNQNTQAKEKATQLFQQEAVRLNALGNHPQIPTLLAYSQQEGRLYLVQEFIEGQTLEQEWQQQGVYDEVKIRQLLQDLLPVLQFVHSQQVIHRDIKPENIIRSIKDGLPVLIDFGVAKLITQNTLLGQGTSVGTMDYAPPEQMRGMVFPSSDLYSLGVTCIRLMTGVRPLDMYDGYNQTWKWRQYLPIQTVSNDLSLILDKLLDYNPQERFQSAESVLQALKPLSSVPPTVVNPVKNPPIQKIESKPKETSPNYRVEPDSNSQTTSKTTKFVYWLMGEQAGKIVVTTWKWLWGMPTK